MVASRYFIALIASAISLPVSAVCLDPTTFVSGYHLPLNTEVQSTRFIGIGKVTHEKALQENRSDPYGITATIYTVKIFRQLKGRLPKTISIKAENDSGRYPMDVGEEYLLFLTKEHRGYFVDSCGNSSALPQGNAALQRVEKKLAQASDAP
jgi:hypothetical protein